ELQLKYGIEQIERGMMFEITAYELQALIETIELAIGVYQFRCDLRQIHGVLLFEAFPDLDRRGKIVLVGMKIAEQDIRAHAFAIDGKRLFEPVQRFVKARIRDMRGGEFAMDIGNFLMP